MCVASLPVKLDTQLFGLGEAQARAAVLAELGLDGVFTFEGPHDVFTPLVLAALVTCAAACQHGPPALDRAHLPAELREFTAG